MSIERGGTTNKPSSTGNFFKRAIATAAVLAALSGEAKEVKTIDANQNQTEIVEGANVGATNEAIANFSVEETTQSNNYYNYIKNIQPSVDRYFPEYSNYFKNVLSKFSEYGTGEKYIVNKQINRTLENYSGSISSEKDKITTVLIVLDYLEGDGKFIKDANIFQKNSDGVEDRRIKVANAILRGIKREYNSFIKDLNNIEKDLKKASEIVESGINDNNITDIINYDEKYMKQFKEYFIDAGIMKESETIQRRIKSYIKILNITGKQPSETGKIYINEYYKIKK